VLCDISSERYVEHDAFSIFSMLMESAASWYVSAERPQVRIPLEANTNN
jgi:hypothetical protein